MKELIETCLKKAMTYTQYNLLFKQLAEKGRTTGEQNKEKIDYTKLNFSRSKRLDKTGKISEESKSFFKNITKKQNWLIISEPWCGDAAQTLPFLKKIAQLSDNIDLKIVLRDENPELMDEFLTHGSRSIPVLIITDEENQVLKHWGPRSKEATQLVNDYKSKNGILDDQFKEQLQLWYNKDKGNAIISDLQEFLN